MSAGVRVALISDLPEIVALYSRVYPKVKKTSLDLRAHHLRFLLFEHPWSSCDVPSLVYEDNAGQIVGFVGIIPRPMIFRDKPVLMAISHNYMVDAESRNTLAGVALAKAFFSGKQQLSVSQPQGQPSRKIWKAFGATSPALQGLSWVWPLRPAAYLADRLQERRLPALLNAAIKPTCWLLDMAAKRILKQQSHNEKSNSVREDLPLEDLVSCMDEFSRRYALRPVHDLLSWKWLWDLLLQKKTYGELRKKGVRAANGQRLGYYVYYSEPNGVSYVLHIGARPDSFAAVFNSLGHDAAESGTLALTGWVDARYVEEISARAFYLKHRRDDPLLTHTRDADLQTILETGNTFLTPTENEWWTWFPDVVPNNTPAA